MVKCSLKLRRFTSIILSRFLLNVREADDASMRSIRSTSSNLSRGMNSLGGTLVFAEDASESEKDIDITDILPEGDIDILEMRKEYEDGAANISFIGRPDDDAEIAYTRA